MSHRPERKEKDCLNCGARVLGRYCQKCGQENLAPKESLWGMVHHFIGDITHFDGKFFSTLKILITKPGFLSAEYMKGKRVSYLNPVRMYVFTSAFFFLVFFSITSSPKAVQYTEDNTPEKDSISYSAHQRDSISHNTYLRDSIPFNARQRDSIINGLKKGLKKDSANSDYLNQISLLKDTARKIRPLDLLPFKEKPADIDTKDVEYNSLAEYDSIQQSKPKTGRDGWLKRTLKKRYFKLNDKYGREGYKQGTRDLIGVFLHKLPSLLFVSLPFFALILKLLYFRRKQYYYADHGIFSIHHYIFSFILMLFIFLLAELRNLSGWKFWDIMQVIIFISWPVYLFKAMRRFYRQGFFKTFVKFLLLNIIGLLVLTFLFMVFGLFAAFDL